MKVRIVQDMFGRYSIQRKFWWFPWWYTIICSGDHNLKIVEDRVERYLNKVIKTY